MSVKTANKFSFKTVFAADGTILRDGDNWRLTFTREEVDIEQKKAYEEGRQDALVCAEQDTASAMKALAEQSSKILSALKQQHNTYREEAFELALMAARKIADTALNHYPDERIKSTVSDVLANLRDAPHLIITCSPAVSVEAENSLQDFAQQNGYEGAMIIKRADEAKSGDIKLEWAKGEISVKTDDIAERIESAVRQWLSATEIHEEAQGDLFNADKAAGERP